MWSPSIKKYFEQQTTSYQESAVLLFIAYMMTKSEELGNLKYKEKIVTKKKQPGKTSIILFMFLYYYV